MKTILRSLNAALLLLVICVGQNSFAGYVNTAFSVGDNLFVNPLQASPNNTLTTLFQYSTIPNGTTISLWNPASSAFDTTSVYQSGSWSFDLLLNPGTGAKLTTSTSFINTFTGNLLNRAGNPFNIGDELLPAPLFSGPAGMYLLGDKLPVASSGSDIFLNILGRLPNNGEQITTLDPATQTYQTATYSETVLPGWDLFITLGVGQAAFLNVGPVPEPSTISLALVGGVLLWRQIRRRSRG